MTSLYHSEFCRIRYVPALFSSEPRALKSFACHGTPRSCLQPFPASAARLGSDLLPPFPAASHQTAALCRGQWRRLSPSTPLWILYSPFGGRASSFCSVFALSFCGFFASLCGFSPVYNSFAGHLRFQVPGDNISTSGYISSLPKSIDSVNTIFDAAE